MSDDTSSLPLFERAISRRSLLAGGAALGAVLAFPTLACGSADGDSTAFSSTSSTTGAPSTTTSPAGGTGNGSGADLPGGATVTTAFTYAMSGGGVAKNPYIAVWVETAAGEFVDTVSLWYQGGRGEKYLSDMRAWNSASGGGADRSMSSATRTPGSYTVVWDGNDASGRRVAEGEYVICIECAREKGPYAVATVPIGLGAEALRVDGTAKGELSKISVTYAP